MADILPNSLPDIDGVRERWGGFAFTPDNEEQAKVVIGRYPPGRQQSAIIPLLDLAQRQIGAETETQGWLPVPVIEYRRRISRYALHPRLRGRDLLHHVQPASGRPLPRPGLRHDALPAARIGRGDRGVQGEGA